MRRNLKLEGCLHLLLLFASILVLSSCEVPYRPYSVESSRGSQTPAAAPDGQGSDTRSSTGSGTSVQGGENTAAAPTSPAASSIISWPLGTATPSEQCAACHSEIYQEYAFGFGADLQYKGMVYKSIQEEVLKLPSGYPSNATAHAYAGVDPWPIRARDVEEDGKSCNVCHYPLAFQIPDMETADVPKPPNRPPDQETPGITCASCHLTPDGKIRGSYDISGAPHETVQDAAMRSSAVCEYCHSQGKRIVGKQTQTFLEWREDYYKPGLGSQQCQDCHMPRTVRKLAENFDVPARPVGRHLWTGDHSLQRQRSSFGFVITQPRSGQSGLEFRVINMGAGHSVPTGSNRRAVYLDADVLDSSGSIVASQEWMFAPNFADRPDDKAFLEEDKNGPEPVASVQADAQGPHEAPIRAGEERILSWAPELTTGNYTVKASLVYDLNRYNDRSFGEDQTELRQESLAVKVD